MKTKLFAIAMTGAALALLAPATQAGECGAPHAHAPKPTTSMNIVETAVQAGDFGTLVKAVTAAGLAEALQGEGPFTVFAPSDAAFALVPEATLEGLLQDREALAGVLTYHVVSGRVPASEVVHLTWAETLQGQSLRVETRDGQVFVDGARVVKADIEASNGIIHVIDRVVLPRKNLVETAVAAGSFNTLVTAVKAADLAETLAEKGPFTVFAPADAAFARLPRGTVEGLLADVPALRGVLTYHVIPGRVLSSDLPLGSTTEVTTVNGLPLTVARAQDGTVTVNGVKVVSADVVGGNGVIHVIDAVLLPSAD